MSDRIGVKLSDDALEAELTIGEGAAADLAALQAALAKAKVTEGIDRELMGAIGKALAEASYTLDEVIARGTAPQEGIDGEIDMKVGEEFQPGQARADGSFDYRDRHNLTVVAAEETIARVQAPTKGKAGVTVTGKKLPAKNGVEAKIILGPGVERDEDELLATRDGVLSYIPGKRVDVVRLVEHNGDVDYASGNLEAQGSLLISGDVQSEFSAAATDDVIIKGAVDDGIVFAGNSIVVAGGAMGKGTELVAKFNIDCRHSREVRMLADGTISIGDHSVNSRLAAKHVQATSGRGAVMGGDVYAQKTISLREAGSRGDVTTVLTVAIPKSKLSILASLWQEEHGGNEDSDQDQQAAQDKGNCLSLEESDRIAEELREALEEKRQLLAEARISISGTAHPGVRIRFAEHEFLVKDPMTGPVFVFDPEAKSIIVAGK